MKILEKIQENFEGLSVTKKKIAKYFCDEWVDVAFCSTRDLAKKIGVSEALIVQFSSDLGYTGFKELQAEIRDNICSEFHRSNKIQKMTDDVCANDCINSVAAICKANLRRTEIDNGVAVYEQAANLLRKARYIYTVGDRNAAAIAVLAGIHINELTNNVRALVGLFGTECDYLRDASAEDVLLLISFPVYSKFTIRLAHKAKSKNVKIISIVDSQYSCYKDISDVTIVVGCESASFHFSHIGSLFAIEILIAMLAKDIGKENLRHIEEIDDITNERRFRYF